MSRAAGLAQLLALRALREERARAALAIAATRLQQASHSLMMEDAAIEEHDRKTGEQERRFLEAMHMRPLSENELGRTREMLGASDHRREMLTASKSAASEAQAECKRQLTAAQQEWRQRLSGRDKLFEIESRLRVAQDARKESGAEQEAEDMNSDRVRP